VAGRLDFTVIGLSVNLVSRIKAVAKSLDLPLVVSDYFSRAWRRAAIAGTTASSEKSGFESEIERLIEGAQTFVRRISRL
jgi:hypothetical protein